MFGRKFEGTFLLSSMILGVANLYVSSVWILKAARQEHQSPPFRPSEKMEIVEAVHPIQGEGPINATQLSCIREHEICRYDDIGDFLESTDLQGIVHEPLPCIPSHRRIPHQKANDWPYILEQRAKLPEDGSMTALMDYNAVLVPLYRNTKSASHGTYTLTSDLDSILLDRLTGRYHPYFSDAEADRVKYLSISRASNLHSCKPKFKFYFGSLAQDYLGLSLLDENLKRIEGTDVAINVDKWLMGNMTANFHDFQIVAVRTTKENQLKDQLFLFPSGHIGTFSFPIDIRRVPPAAQSSKYGEIPWDSKLKGNTVTSSSEYKYGDGFQLRFIDGPGQFERNKSHRRGDLLYKTRGVDRCKNFHIFESSNGKTFMEAWPHGLQPRDSHISVSINFFASSFEPSSEMNLFPNREFKAVKGKRYQSLFHDVHESREGSPEFSFKTVTPKHERPFMRFRGTSQIIDMVLTGKNVKVGISHTVSDQQKGHTDKRAYLSQFYAFLPDPPFEIVAITGHFCFNHMDERDSGYSSQWISGRPTDNRTAPILVMDKNYRCPIISFASGMTEMIGHDGKNVIITYGVNDCYSRSIVVPKKKIEMLLLGQSNDSVNDATTDTM